MINVADLPAVRAQLQRDAAVAKDEQVPVDVAPAAQVSEQAGREAVYPAGNLVFESGRYRVVTRENSTP